MQNDVCAWGKSDSNGTERHHLLHHSADVAAVFETISASPLWRRRLESAAERELSDPEISCLAALAFLHDIGKIAPAFQAKAWPDGHGLRLRGHLECGFHWLRMARPEALDGAVAHLARWPGIRDWFDVIFAHHGRPVAEPAPGEATSAFAAGHGYDWQAQERLMGQALLEWFPQITHTVAPAPHPKLAHFFCGLLTLADWIASDRRAFEYEPDFRDDYIDVARRRAHERVGSIGLGPSPDLRAGSAWTLISDHPTPRPAQEAVGQIPASDQLLILEAETGAGKTEAALWRFVTLVAAGEVEALYFAVPTRAAARQLQRRVNAALQRMFVQPPEAILAIPGQAISGEARGIRLPDFRMTWDDTQAHPARWAAEHAARYLAARIGVGTVDQAALGGLQVKYAHLRGASLARALLVIDEVHASDPYMTETQLSLVNSHLELGGHVLLMSATLGTAARARWRKEEPVPFEAAAALPYPAVWTSTGLQPIRPDPDAGKSVRISVCEGWSGEDGAALALAAARQGARVLVIRNTVQRAQETYASCLSGAPDLLLQVNGHPTLHHSRFAAEDRSRLDHAVETAIGKDSPIGGRIVIGTQTLEQSLDLCADLLITDLCPMDVLLQRIGRLHRHRRPRPAGFEEPRALVLAPSNGLDGLTRAAENGLGARADGPSLSGVYVNMASIAATLDQIRQRPIWQIPTMNRVLVEAATHPEALRIVAEHNGWQGYHQRVVGRALAEMNTANLRVLDRSAPIAPFPDDEAIRTRLGEEGIILELPPGTVGAFGAPISRLALPAHWSRGLTGEEPASVFPGPPLVIGAGPVTMTYGPEGLQRGERHDP